MRFSSILLAGLSAATLALAAPAQEAQEAAEPAFSVEVNADLVSHYLWRGFDVADGGPLLQPALTVSHRSGLWATAWGTAALSGRRRELAAGGVRRDVDELDLSVGITRELRGVEVEAAALWYGYPSLDGFPDAGTTTWEPYVQLTATRLPLSPAATVRYDTNLGDGWSAAVELEHADSVGAFEVKAGAEAGWMKQNWRLTSGGGQEAGFSDVMLSLGLSRTVGRVTIAPTLAWTRLLEGDTTPRDDTVWGKLSLTFTP